MPDKLTDGQLKALHTFAIEHGKKWKDDLYFGWMKSAYPGALQQIRNQQDLGPSWLQGVSVAMLKDEMERRNLT